MQYAKLTKLQPGDKVAVLSPSAGLPGLFPWVQDLGLSRMREDFGLVPVEYPTTRQMGSSLEDRARDVMAAFADPEIKAIITSIGGSDQIMVLKFLDADVIRNNPKPFFGFSDNTHLHIYLSNLGIPSYYGGAAMTQFAMQGGMHDMTVSSIRRALFEEGEFELEVSSHYTDEGLDWSDESNLDSVRKMEPNDGLFWDGTANAEGRLWGGCAESLIVQSTTGIYLPETAELENKILFLETAEDIPEHWIISYLLTGFGERGWLDVFQAVLVGRPKAWEFDKQNDTAAKADYRRLQRETVLNMVRAYNKHIPVVQNLDFGHTDPQVVLPYSGNVKLKAAEHKIILEY